MKLGRNLARTFLDYYKLQNIIVFNPASSTLMPKLASSTTYLNLKSHQQNSSTSPVQSSNGNLKNLSSLNAGGANSANSSTANKKKAMQQTASTSQILKTTPSFSLSANLPSSPSAANSNDTNEKAPSPTTKFFLDNELE